MGKVNLSLESVLSDLMRNKETIKATLDNTYEGHILSELDMIISEVKGMIQWEKVGKIARKAWLSSLISQEVQDNAY